jgi:hypothetical protein
MSYAQLHADIRGRFITEWSNNTPIDNSPNFTKPAGPYVSLTILDNETGRTEVGRDAYQMQGLIIIQLFTPPGFSLYDRDLLIDLAAEIFRSKTFDGIYTDSPYPNYQGVSDGWRQTNITFTFSKDVIY